MDAGSATILARHGVAHLAAIDPITGERVQGSRRSQNHYEHRRPGDMIHVDVEFSVMRFLVR